MTRRLGIKHILPMLLALAAIGGLISAAIATRGSLPPFASLFKSQAIAADDWCAEHGVPESICVECQPAKFPKLNRHGWCRDHGIAECPHCHPEAAQLQHQASIDTTATQRLTRATAVAARPTNDTKCKLHERRLQLASASDLNRLGITLVASQTRPLSESVIVAAEVMAEPTRTARLASRASGSVVWVGPKFGSNIAAEEVVALIDAPAVGVAKAEFAQALAKLARSNQTLLTLKDAGVPGRTIRQARQDADEARLRLDDAARTLAELGLPIVAEQFTETSATDVALMLRSLGLSPELARQFDSPNLLPIRSPFAGILTQRNISPGEVIDAAKPLFVVTDSTRPLIELHVRAEDAAQIRLGQRIRFRADHASDSTTGTLTWLSPIEDHASHTVVVRAELDGSLPRLSPGVFGTAEIELRQETAAITVPNSAVHFEGCCHIVFVRDRHFEDSASPKLFHVRKVRIGTMTDGQTEILAGVLPGEIVAAEGSGVLRAELLKNGLGAGCTCGH